MTGLGTIINTGAIIAGGIMGMLFGKLLNERVRQSLNAACGICVLFIGMAGVLEGMLSLKGSDIISGKAMLLTGCLCIGALVGGFLDIEGGFERFGEWLKIKSGNAKDSRFVGGFVNASLTVCIGAMAIVGSIRDAVAGDISVLVTKAVLDLIIVMVMAGAMGVGCVFSALPVAVFQGSLTALAYLVKPIMTEAALSNLSLVGSVLVFCVGINLVFGKKVSVANMLPSMVIAVIAAFINI